MSTYTTLEVDGYTLLSTARYADAAVLTVFRDSDKYLHVVRIREDGSHEPVDKQIPTDFEVDEDDEQLEIGYRARGAIVRDRLDVMGFTLPATRAVFERGIAARLERLRHWLQPEHGYLWANEIEVLSELTFDRWLTSFAVLKARGATKWSTTPDLLHYAGVEAPVEVDPMGRYMLGDDGEYPFKFPNVDIRYFLRAIVEACGADTMFCQDLTGVVAAGYYWYEDQIAESASAALEEDFPVNARVIVLTEGVTDRRALEGSLALLYPYLSDYFGFMDFDGAAIAGGAGPLVATIKAFAGAGIANRVIALFDNDTAAQAALRGLQRVELPASIKVARYPDLPLADNYPTLGPTGASTSNVNGFAASLELYFGEDVLRKADGSLTPVVWRNYEGAVAAYQGEVAEKATLQRKFEEKLAAAVADPSLVSSLDWSGMRMILAMLIGAFTNQPSEVPDD